MVKENEYTIYQNALRYALTGECTIIHSKLNQFSNTRKINHTDKGYKIKV